MIQVTEDFWYRDSIQQIKKAFLCSTFMQLLVLKEQIC